MENKNTETNELLGNQKKILEGLDKEHQLLLSADNKESQYDDVKRMIGWDDTDKVIREKYNKVLELKEITKKNIDATILDDESIWNYCIDNNYVITNIKNYKGQVPDELLAAISDYSKSADRRLDSNANLDELFILCRFVDTFGSDNSDIKKSKRYKQGQLPKIMLLERQIKGNAYKENHYKIIFEIGVKTPITNLWNSIFKTHGKSDNLLANFQVFGLICLGINIIALLLTTVGKITPENVYFAFTGWKFIPTIITFVILTSTYSDYNNDFIGTYKHKEYSDWKYKGWYNHLSTTLYNDTNLKIFNLKKIKFKMLLSYIIMISIFLTISLFTVKLNNVILLSKQNVLIYDITNGNTITRDTYIRDGIFTYIHKIEVIDKTDPAEEAAIKIIKDKVRKNYKK